MTTESIEFEFSKLDLQPGDVVVIRCRHHLHRADVDSLQEVFGVIAEKFGVGGILLQEGWDISTLTDEQLEAAGLARVGPSVVVEGNGETA